MNNSVENFARQSIKDGLKKLPEGWQNRFKQMYANGKISDDINTVVDNMPEEKLDWALSQVEESIKKINNQNITMDTNRIENNV